MAPPSSSPPVPNPAPAAAPAPAQAQASPPPKRQAHHDLATKVQAYVLLQLNIPRPHITKFTGVSLATLNRIQKRVRERGYNPDVDKKLLDAYFTNESIPGRPKKRRDEEGKEGEEVRVEEEEGAEAV